MKFEPAMMEVAKRIVVLAMVTFVNELHDVELKYPA